MSTDDDGENVLHRTDLISTAADAHSIPYIKRQCRLPRSGDFHVVRTSQSQILATVDVVVSAILPSTESDDQSTSWLLRPRQGSAERLLSRVNNLSATPSDPHLTISPTGATLRSWPPHRCVVPLAARSSSFSCAFAACCLVSPPCGGGRPSVDVVRRCHQQCAGSIRQLSDETYVEAVLKGAAWVVFRVGSFVDSSGSWGHEAQTPETAESPKPASRDWGSTKGHWDGH